MTQLTSLIYRDIAQMVARVIWDHEVVGSSPTIPIQKKEGGLLCQTIVTM